MDALALEGWPEERTLTLSGAPRALRLPITLSNGSTRPLAVAEASLSAVTLGQDGPSLRLEPVPVGLVVPAGGAATANIRLRLDRATPAGVYSGRLRVAGIDRAVEIVVTADTAVDVRPDPVIVDAALGRSASVAVSFENRGNVALTLDPTGRYRLGEELSLGTRPVPEGGEGLAALRELLDLIPGLARRPALVDVGEVALSMPGGPVTLAPGDAATVEVQVRLPETLSVTARYHVYAPLYAADLHIVVVTTAKPAPPARASRRAKQN
jgi:hypothetical protein